MTLKQLGGVFLVEIPSAEWSAYSHEVRRLFRCHAHKASYRRRTLILSFSPGYLKTCRNRLAFHAVFIPSPETATE